MIAIAVLLGLAVGSFLNVCIHRWPLGESVVSPGSHCPRCQRPIAWRDNLPILSFLLLRARCRLCGRPISARYPLVEMATATHFALAAALFGPSLAGAKAALFCAMCTVLACADLERFVLPDQITLGGLPVGIALSVAVPLRPGISRIAMDLTGLQLPAWGASLVESCLSAALFGGLFWAVAEAYFRLRGVEGLGFGDVKLAAMLGAFLGGSETLLVLLVACMLGTVVGLSLQAAGRARWNSPLPLGSFLSGTAALAPFCADPILKAYWEFLLG